MSYRIDYTRHFKEIPTNRNIFDYEASVKYYENQKYSPPAARVAATKDLQAAANLYFVRYTDKQREAYIDKVYGGDEASLIGDFAAARENDDFKRFGPGYYFQDDYELLMKEGGDFDKYYREYQKDAGVGTAGDVFGGGGDSSDVSSEDVKTYEERRKERGSLLKRMLGDEMYALGEDIDPVKLIDFAEWEPVTEGDLVQDAGKVTPLKDRKKELTGIATGETKEDTGKQAREMFSKAASRGIPGLQTALGSMSGASAMESSFSRMADKASAQNAMAQRVAQFQDKQEAINKLSKMTSGLLAFDMKRANELKSLRAKTTVGMAGAQLTAAEHAAQLAKATSSL